MSIERVQKLIERAVHPGTPIEEARTCAMVAVKMISDGKIRLGEPQLAPAAMFEEPSRRRWPSAGPTPKARPRTESRTPPPIVDRVIVAKTAGFCSDCGDTYVKGERVVWLASQRQFVHIECFRQRGGRTEES